jgi:hypothetical protein
MLREGYQALRRHEAVLRCDILGLPVDPEEREAANNQYDRFYEKWFPYGKF